MPQLSMVIKVKVIKGFSPRVFWAYSLGSEGGILILWYNQMAPTSFPGFSPTHPTERERERPWKMLVTCLPESGRLQTNDLGEEQVSVRFVSKERSAAIKL